MTQQPHLTGQRAVAAAEIVTLAGFGGFALLPDPQRAMGAVVMALGALATLVLDAARLRHAPGQLPLWAVLSTLGLGCAVAYLHSLDEVAAIPLVGVAVLFLCLVGLIVTSTLLWAKGAPRPLRS